MARNCNRAYPPAPYPSARDTATASALQAGDVSSPSENPIQRSSSELRRHRVRTKQTSSFARVSAHTGIAPGRP